MDLELFSFFSFISEINYYKNKTTTFTTLFSGIYTMSGVTFLKSIDLTWVHILPSCLSKSFGLGQVTQLPYF